MSRLKSNLCLLLTSMIWGCAFVAQSVASDSVGPCTFNGIRFLIGALTVRLLLPLLSKISLEEKETERDSKTLWKAGMVSGVILFAASILQQAGIAWTTAGKAGFLTSLYVVLVPLFGLFFHRIPKKTVFLASLLAVFALYLLSSPENGTIGKGELLEMLAAVCFTAHVYAIDYFAPRVDAAKYSAVQFVTAGVLGMIGMVLFEPLSSAAVRSALLPILYAGILSAGLGYTLQAYGQKGAEPAVASVIMSLESVFSVIFGFLILHEVLSGRELLGCALMFAAVLLSQR